MSVVEAVAAAGPAAAGEAAAAATSVVDSNAGAPSLDLAQVGSTAAMMEPVSSVADAPAPAAGASVVDSSLNDRRRSNGVDSALVRPAAKQIICLPSSTGLRCAARHSCLCCCQCCSVAGFLRFF